MSKITQKADPCLWDYKRLREFEPDPRERILGENLITQGGLSLLVGPPDVGKTKIAIQLAVNLVSGRSKWLKQIDIHQNRLKVFFVQTENSPTRINYEIGRALNMRRIPPTHPIFENLKFYIPKTIKDRSMLNQRTQQKISRMIEEIEPDLVIFDPYRDFFVGNNENDAVDTRKTIYWLMRIAQVTNPKAATLVIHHSLTGQNALRKAYGPEASEYARGSKALMSIARCQINCAPRRDILGDEMVIVCAKNNDGPKFAPFGLRRNPVSDQFEYDESFDFDEWNKFRKNGKGEQQPKSKVTKEHFQTILKDTRLSKKLLSQKVQKTAKCSQSTAYEAIGKSLEKGILKMKKGKYLIA